MLRLSGKRLEILGEVVLKLSRVAVLDLDGRAATHVDEILKVKTPVVFCVTILTLVPQTHNIAPLEERG